jgi:diguanylate cyclase (GGDEF)-like protein
MNLIDLMKHMEARTKKLLKSQIDTYKAEEAAKQHKIDAMIDKLTGLYNRRKIDEVLENELKRSIRYRTPFTLLIIDVDNFKVINDQYGHAKGDDILIDVAGILNSTVRNTDFVGRWGGDEFVIIAVESTEMQTRTLADKIVEGFRNYDKGINISTSIGMAQVNVDRDDTRSLLQKADEALYVAKSSGRNCTVAYKDLGAINEK